jgi:hypothetical protein
MDEIHHVPYGTKKWRVAIYKPHNFHMIAGTMSLLHRAIEPEIFILHFDERGSPVQGPDGVWYMWGPDHA